MVVPGLVALHPVQDARDVAGRVNDLCLALADEGVLQQLVVLGPHTLVLWGVPWGYFARNKTPQCLLTTTVSFKH